LFVLVVLYGIALASKIVFGAFSLEILEPQRFCG